MVRTGLRVTVACFGEHVGLLWGDSVKKVSYCGKCVCVWVYGG